MRPRGETQKRYNEALQCLSGRKSLEKTVLESQDIFVETMKLREANPIVVCQLWNAIAYVRQQKQIPNLERLAGFMKRMYDMSPTVVETELKKACYDGLILIRTAVGCKGSKIGVEQDGYRVPEAEFTKGDHDWYCFSCHKGGDVALCSSCFRVFHLACIEGKYDPVKFVCNVCKLQKTKYSTDIDKDELNALLSHTSVRLKEKTRELHRIPQNEDKWRFDCFVYKHMDLITMEMKMRNNEYETLEEFYIDALQIVHNVILFYGDNCKSAVLANQMLFDCDYDLNEISQCRNCYNMSNQKGMDWFCQPCNPPHELVFAKQKGYPYWPAKVMKKVDGLYDVRFFGGFHQRAYVVEAYIRPITTSIQQLGLKKTASLARATKELHHHQSLLEQSQSGNAGTTVVKVMLDRLKNGSPVKRLRPGRPPKNKREDDLNSAVPSAKKRKIIVRNGKEEVEDKSRMRSEEKKIIRTDDNSKNTKSDDDRRRARSDEDKKRTRSDEDNKNTKSDDDKKRSRSDEEKKRTRSDEDKKRTRSNEDKKRTRSDEDKKKTRSDEDKKNIKSDADRKRTRSDEDKRNMKADDGKKRKLEEEKEKKKKAIEKKKKKAVEEKEKKRKAMEEKERKKRAMEEKEKKAMEEKKKKAEAEKEKKEKKAIEEKEKKATEEREKKRKFEEDKKKTKSEEKKNSKEIKTVPESQPEVLSPARPFSEDQNIVSSSSQEALVTYATAATQTNSDPSFDETDNDESNKNHLDAHKKIPSCNCKEKFNKMFSDMNKSLEKEHKEDKAKSQQDLSEKLQKEFEAEKQKAVSAGFMKLRQKMEQLQKKSEEQSRLMHEQKIQKLLEHHKQQISETKKKQWCYNCEAEAIYHCCWNTAYCSVECQQSHWHKEHKRSCRRKR